MTRAAEWKLISKDSDKTILKMENTTVFFVCFESSDVIVNKTCMNTIMFIIAKNNNNKLPSL